MDLSDHEQQTEEHVSTVDEAQSLWNRQEALVRLLNKEALLKRICQIFMINAPKLTDLKDQFECKIMRKYIKLRML